MAFHYTSMLDPTRINKIRQAVEKRFKYYDTSLHEWEGYSVPVGFEREVVSTTDGDVVYNNFDHPDEPDFHDHAIKLGTLDNTPDEIISTYRCIVNEHHLDEQTRQREQDIYDWQHSDILAFDD